MQYAHNLYIFKGFNYLLIIFTPLIYVHYQQQHTVHIYKMNAFQFLNI